MSIKVIKRGKLPESIKWVGVCDYCYSEMIADYSDVRASVKNPIIKIADCPVCGYGVIFKPEIKENQESVK